MNKIIKTIIIVTIIGFTKGTMNLLKDIRTVEYIIKPENYRGDL